MSSRATVLVYCRYEELWNIRYLSRFKWTHLNERLAYEREVHQLRLRTEVMQVRTGHVGALRSASAYRVPWCRNREYILVTNVSKHPVGSPWR